MVQWRQENNEPEMDFSKSKINPTFAKLAAEAITALDDGQALKMAANIARYLGASPKEAVAKAPEVVARAIQLRTYEATSAAGPA
jgi:hydroxymethylpyrimidine/phosphomethylpyrimidine kinase